MLEEQDVIDMNIEAQLGEICVRVCTEEKNITQIKIKGLESNVVMTKAEMNITAKMKDLIVFDPHKETLYPKVK